MSHQVDRDPPGVSQSQSIDNIGGVRSKATSSALWWMTAHWRGGGGRQGVREMYHYRFRWARTTTRTCEGETFIDLLLFFERHKASDEDLLFARGTPEKREVHVAACELG